MHRCLFVSSGSPESEGEKEYISLDELKKAVKSMKSEKFKSHDMKVRGGCLLFFPLGVATVVIQVILLPLCIICVFLYQQLSSRILLKGGHGMFSMSVALGACCLHEGETDTDESEQALIGKIRRMALHPVVSRGQTLATGFIVLCRN